MSEDFEKRLAGLEQKLDAVYRSVEKMRKYFLWTLIVGVVTFVLPLIGLAFVIPYYFSILSGSYGNLF
jgi:hypothetical protein